MQDSRDDKHIRKTIEHEIKRQILVSCDVEVEDYGGFATVGEKDEEGL